MSQPKVTKVSNNKIAGSNQEPVHTQLSMILSVLAILIMAFLGIRHVTGLGYEEEWGKFALAQACWGLIGYTGTQLIKREKLLPQRFRIIEFNTIFLVIITLVFAMGTQILMQYTFSISNTEQALYYVFSAVCEELFFRLFLINVFLQFADDELHFKIIAIITESAAFAAVHQNYYSNIGMLVGVFLGGVVFGIAYLKTKNITVCILAHFILNLIATANWLVNI